MKLGTLPLLVTQQVQQYLLPGGNRRCRLLGQRVQLRTRRLGGTRQVKQGLACGARSDFPIPVGTRMRRTLDAQFFLLGVLQCLHLLQQRGLCQIGRCHFSGGLDRQLHRCLAAGQRLDLAQIRVVVEPAIRLGGADHVDVLLRTHHDAARQKRVVHPAEIEPDIQANHKLGWVNGYRCRGRLGHIVEFYKLCALTKSAL